MRLLLVCALSWGVVHYFRYIGCPVPFFNGYLTDFLAVPAMAHVALLVTRRFLLRDAAYVYPFSWIMIIAAYVSLVMEVAAPAFSPVYTGDWADAVAYFGGGVCYHLYMKLRAKPA